ncbi:lipopolysaccharide biosynthesis protein, partial [Paenibacillus sp. P46E]|uniref:lipopolysaccharide biosynthesis protein n=1 Tax=Paenibacillus sp. P46E TaxID=1349436 RepID=UPI000A7B24DA
NKNYPYLKSTTHQSLDPDVKSNIIQNIKALLLANISVYFIFGTDNLLLSLLTHVSIVGIYSNYTLIFNAVKGFMSQVFVGTTASFGNLLASDAGLEEADRIFKIMFFINFWLSTFCSAALLLLINPFINLWIGSSMLLSGLIVVILVFNFYSDTMRSAVELVKSAAGLYSPYPFFKYWIVVEAILNLLLAIIFAGGLKMGMTGIFLATSISTFIPTYIIPWNIYKYVFGKSSKEFYLKHIL